MLPQGMRQSAVTRVTSNRMMTLTTTRQRTRTCPPYLDCSAVMMISAGHPTTGVPRPQGHLSEDRTRAPVSVCARRPGAWVTRPFSGSRRHRRVRTVADRVRRRDRFRLQKEDEMSAGSSRRSAEWPVAVGQQRRTRRRVRTNPGTVVRRRWTGLPRDGPRRLAQRPERGPDAGPAGCRRGE